MAFAYYCLCVSMCSSQLATLPLLFLICKKACLLKYISFTCLNILQQESCLESQMQFCHGMRFHNDLQCILNNSAHYLYLKKTYIINIIKQGPVDKYVPKAQEWYCFDNYGNVISIINPQRNRLSAFIRLLPI